MSWDGFGHFLWALTISWSRLLAHVWSGPKYFEPLHCSNDGHLHPPPPPSPTHRVYSPSGIFLACGTQEMLHGLPYPLVLFWNFGEETESPSITNVDLLAPLLNFWWGQINLFLQILPFSNCPLFLKICHYDSQGVHFSLKTENHVRLQYIMRTSLCTIYVCVKSRNTYTLWVTKIKDDNMYV